MHRCHWKAYLLALLAALPLSAPAMELSGRVGYEWRGFANQAAHPGQPGRSNQSLFLEPEFYWQWNEGDDRLVFKPFVRVDEHDSRRSHGDIRELLWLHVADGWEVKAGIGKVFWGVTEFRHLVDVINQTDGVEDEDGEDKLGQPLLNLSLVRDWGILDLYLLPGFRERTFAGSHGRLRSALVVDTDRARYSSSAGQHHLDGAIRWSQSVGDYDLGAYWFHGTNRDPLLVREGNRLIPLYEQMDQLALDLQATKGDWLWKLESLYRHSDSQEFVALQGGFEYTRVGIADTPMDLGLLLEYGWDSRGRDGDSPIQDDLFLGTRLTLNDMQSSELLAGFGQDLDHGGYSVSVEASRRLGQRWTLSLDARLYHSDERRDPLYSLRKDDRVQLTLERYF